MLWKKIKFIEDKHRIRPLNSEVKRLLCDNRKAKKFSNGVRITQI